MNECDYFDAILIRVRLKFYNNSHKTMVNHNKEKKGDFWGENKQNMQDEG